VSALGFVSNPFLPHGVCYQWNAALIWLHVISDLLIATAYLVIPVFLLYFAKKNKDLHFRWVFLCFAIFIAACGATHIMEVVTLWVPAYWTSGVIKCLTALASVPTAVLVARKLPQALTLVSAERLRETNQELEAQSQALRESDSSYRDLVEHSQDLICTHDEHGVVLSINEAPLKILGYSREDLLNKPLRNFVTPEAQRMCDEYLRRVQRDGVARGLLPVLTKNGQVKLWEYNNSVRLDGSRTVRGIAHDVTEQKRAERALRNSEEKFSKAFALSPLLLAICTIKEGRFTEVNDALVRQSGYSRDELIGQAVSDIGLWADPTQREALLEEISQGGCIRNREAKFRARSGQIAMLLLSMEVLEIAGETCLLTVGHDITAQKAVEEALRASEERFRLMAENIKEIFWTIEPGTLNLRYASPAYEEIWERSQEEIQRDPTAYLQSIHPDDTARILEKFRRLETENHLEDECRIVCPGGRIKWVHSRAFTVRDSQSRLTTFVGTTRDMTARKKSEEVLLQAQKMEAVGLLASGVAHDFNNVLTIVLGYAQLLLKTVSTPDKNKAGLQKIVDASFEGRELTAKLLAFGRTEVSQARPINLDAEIYKIEDMLKRLISENIEVRVFLNCHAKRILAEPATVIHIVMNLAINARDAMASGGVLTISTSTVSLTADDDYAPVPPGYYALLEVIDTGCGMDAAARAHMFDPFFTTKPTGQGTGLGLSMVYRIVSQCSGHIRVESELGRGSTFRIYLPLFEGDSVGASDSRGTRFDENPKKVLIMVVEDNGALREVVREGLEDRGYSVRCEARGATALRHLEREGSQIRVLLTDVVMPDMSGVDLARKLRRQIPDLKILFMTGWAPGGGLAAEDFGHGSDLIGKPFEIQELDERIRRLLSVDNSG
jgi:PAS domain S-box-containing protein